jgi:hypothetical protein
VDDVKVVVENANENVKDVVADPKDAAQKVADATK